VLAKLHGLLQAMAVPEPLVIEGGVEEQSQRTPWDRRR
jgi:hypothetical protein